MNRRAFLRNLTGLVAAAAAVMTPKIEESKLTSAAAISLLHNATINPHLVCMYEGHTPNLTEPRPDYGFMTISNSARTVVAELRQCKRCGEMYWLNTQRPATV